MIPTLIRSFAAGADVCRQEKNCGKAIVAAAAPKARRSARRREILSRKAIEIFSRRDA